MVDAQPRDDRREIRARGADVSVAVLTRSEPRVLENVLGFAGAAKHPISNREQQRSMRLERWSVPLGCHGSGPLAYFCCFLKFRRMTRALCDSADGSPGRSPRRGPSVCHVGLPEPFDA